MSELTEYGRQIGVEDGDDIVAGEWARDVLRQDGVCLGYMRDPLDGVRPVRFPRDNWQRHQLATGTAGYGKSTFLAMTAVQMASDVGIAYIDPKGDDASALYRMLPPERADDVVWIDTERPSAGFNALAVGAKPDDDHYEREVEGVVKALENVFFSYGGRRQIDAFREITRAYIRDADSPSMEGLYNAVVDATERRRLLEATDEPPRLGRIAEDVVDSIARRLRRAMDGVVREVAFQQDGIGARQALSEDSILLVRIPTANPERRQLIWQLFCGWLWRGVARRTEVPPGERTPFHLFVDEFDELNTESATIDRVLSRGRALGLGVTISLEKLNALDTDTKQAVLGNCGSLIAFNPTDKTEANELTARFSEDISRADLLSQGRFEYFLRMLNDYGEMITVDGHTFPRLPPHRSGLPPTE